MDYLDSLTFEHLRGIGRALQVRACLTKSEMVQSLTQALAGPGLPQALARLTEMEQKAVAAALYAPDRVLDRTRFQIEWGPIQAQNEALLGMFLGRGGQMAYGMAERLKAFVKPLPSVLLRPTPDEDLEDELTLLETAGPALEDVRNLLRRAELGALKVSPVTGRLTATGLKALRKTLSLEDYFLIDDSTAVNLTMRPYAWPLLLTGGKLVSPVSGTLELTRAGKAALGQPAQDVLRTLWRNYLQWKDYDEFERIRVVSGQRGKGRVMAPVPPRREAIADTLALLPVGAWVHIDELFRYLRASGHNFEIAHDVWRLYVGGSPDWGSMGRSHAFTWELLQGRYVMVFLMEYAATLGLLDLAYTTPDNARPEELFDLYGMAAHDSFSPYDGLTFVRLNPLGAYCLGLTDRYQPAASALAAALSANGQEVRPMQPLPSSTELYLDRIAERTPDGWTMSLDSLQRAATEGLLPQDVRTFLSQETGAPLAYSTEMFLREVEQWLGRCRDAGTARILWLAPADLKRVQQERKLAGLFLVAGEHLIIPEQHEATVLKALRKLGYWVAPSYFVHAADQPTPVDPKIGDDLLKSLLG